MNCDLKWYKHEWWCISILGVVNLRFGWNVANMLMMTERDWSQTQTCRALI